MPVATDTEPLAIVFADDGLVPNNPLPFLVYKGAIDNKRSTDLADVKTATNYVKVALEAVMAGKTVATTATQPYGCSVKYASK